MPQYLRVRDNETGAKFSVVDSAVEDHMTVLKNEPATDAHGDPLRDEPGEPKSSANKAATSKENS